MNGPHFDHSFSSRISQQPACDKVDAFSPENRLHTAQTAGSAIFQPENGVLYVPDRYEPKYAYPLLVWLHGSGESERQLNRLMPQISQQNYLGLSLRGQAPAVDGLPGGYSWSLTTAERMAFEEELELTIKRIGSVYNFHTERIYLAGFGDGADLAYQMLMHRPEWFAGAALFGSDSQKRKTSLVHYRHLQGKRILFGTGTRDARVEKRELLETSRLLHLAGLQVSFQFYDAGHELQPRMLRDIDHWVMSSISSAYLVT